MTDTLDAPTAPPEPIEPRRSSTTVFAIVAVAVVALVVVAVVAMTRDSNSHTSMMGSSGMGQMMNGPMTAHVASNPTVPGAREVAVSATSFQFTPNEIHVRTNEDVTIALAASDVGHDFTIDDLRVHVAAAPGALGRGGLHAPSTPGRYTAYCSVAGHRAAGMAATVVVDPS